MKEPTISINRFTKRIAVFDGLDLIGEFESYNNEEFALAEFKAKIATVTDLEPKVVYPVIRSMRIDQETEMSAPKTSRSQATASLLQSLENLEDGDKQAEIDRLNAIINTPQANDFLRAVSIEAEHQRQRWGAEGDAGKTPADWFWLVGYLAGKALHAQAGGSTEKAEHHIITTAAACANWHLAMFGKTSMRPGHGGPDVVEFFKPDL